MKCINDTRICMQPRKGRVETRADQIECERSCNEAARLFGNFLWQILKSVVYFPYTDELKYLAIGIPGLAKTEITLNLNRTFKVMHSKEFYDLGVVSQGGCRVSQPTYQADDITDDGIINAIRRDWYERLVMVRMGDPQLGAHTGLQLVCIKTTSELLRDHFVDLFDKDTEYKQRLHDKSGYHLHTTYAAGVRGGGGTIYTLEFIRSDAIDFDIITLSRSCGESYRRYRFQPY